MKCRPGTICIGFLGAFSDSAFTELGFGGQEIYPFSKNPQRATRQRHFEIARVHREPYLARDQAAEHCRLSQPGEENTTTLPNVCYTAVERQRAHMHCAEEGLWKYSEMAFDST